MVFIVKVRFLQKIFVIRKKKEDEIKLIKLRKSKKDNLKD